MKKNIFGMKGALDGYPRPVVVGVMALLILGVVGYVLIAKGIITTPYFNVSKENVVFEHAVNQGVNSQLSGNYQDAKTKYEQGLSGATTDNDKARLKLRIAYLDTLGQNPEKGIAELKDIVADTSVLADIRARAGLVALLTFANNRTLPTIVRDTLFSGEPWNGFYPGPRTQDVYEQDAALVKGYEYVLTIGDPYYAHFLAARILAMFGQKTAGEERAQYADRARNHVFLGLDGEELPVNNAFWPEGYIAVMRLEGVRALTALYPLVNDGTIKEPRITRQFIQEKFNTLITYCSDEQNKLADISILSSRLLVRFYFASFLSQFSDLKNEELQQTKVFLEEYAALPDTVKPAFQRDFGFLRARGDGTKYVNDTRREAAIRLGRDDAAFKAFLIDSLGGWDENDFK